VHHVPFHTCTASPLVIYITITEVFYLLTRDSLQWLRWKPQKPLKPLAHEIAEYDDEELDRYLQANGR